MPVEIAYLIIMLVGISVGAGTYILGLPDTGRSPLGYVAGFATWAGFFNLALSPLADILISDEGLPWNVMFVAVIFITPAVLTYYLGMPKLPHTRVSVLAVGACDQLTVAPQNWSGVFAILSNGLAIWIFWVDAENILF